MQTPGQHVEGAPSAPEKNIRRLSRLATELFLRLIRPASYEAERNLRYSVESKYPEEFRPVPQVDPELWVADPAYAQQLQNFQLQQNAAHAAVQSTFEQAPVQQAYQPMPANYASQVGPDREQVPADDFVHSGQVVASEIQQWLASGAIPQQREQV